MPRPPKPTVLKSPNPKGSARGGVSGCDTKPKPGETPPCAANMPKPTQGTGRIRGTPAESQAPTDQ